MRLQRAIDLLPQDHLEAIRRPEMCSRVQEFIRSVRHEMELRNDNQQLNT